MQSTPHHCTYDEYGCGHRIIHPYCAPGSGDGRNVEYRGGLTRHRQRPTRSMYMLSDCPNCRAAAAASDLARFAPAVG